MDNISKVFVYGTLKAGRPLDRLAFAKLRTSVKEATIVGSIYNLGSFPTIKLDGKGQVHGEVHTFEPDDFDEILLTMDRIEGYNEREPRRGLYNRHIVEATTADGKIEKAWAYEYNGSVDESRRLENGLWEPNR